RNRSGTGVPLSKRSSLRRDEPSYAHESVHDIGVTLPSSDEGRGGRRAVGHPDSRGDRTTRKGRPASLPFVIAAIFMPLRARIPPRSVDAVTLQRYRGGVGGNRGAGVFVTIPHDRGGKAARSGRI